MGGGGGEGGVGDGGGDGGGVSIVGRCGGLHWSASVISEIYITCWLKSSIELQIVPFFVYYSLQIFPLITDQRAFYIDFCVNLSHY